MKNNLVKSSTSIDKINKFSKSLGLKDNEKTVLEVVKSTDTTKLLNLRQGSYSNPEPWFIIDEDDKVHTILSIASLKDLLENVRELRKENFELRLEKAIFQRVPIDFNDVWLVAMDEIKKQMMKGVSDLSIDLDVLLEQIKKEHPNLFVDVNAFLAGKDENERL